MNPVTNIDQAAQVLDVHALINTESALIAAAAALAAGLLIVIYRHGRTRG